jgi:hypothetical protein
MKPLARIEGLTIRELPDEVILLDTARDQAHCLNLVAATVWRQCDGTRTTADLASNVSETLQRPVPEAAIELALEQLTKRGLLATPVIKAGTTRRMERREALRVAAMALAIPIMLTIASPARAQTITQCARAGASHVVPVCASGTVPKTVPVAGGTCYAGCVSASSSSSSGP